MFHALHGNDAVRLALAAQVSVAAIFNPGLRRSRQASSRRTIISFVIFREFRSGDPVPIPVAVSLQAHVLAGRGCQGIGALPLMP
jgi:hypothetical protein